MRQLLILFALSAAHTSTKQQGEIGSAGKSLVRCAPLISATLDLSRKTQSCCLAANRTSFRYRTSLLYIEGAHITSQGANFNQGPMA